MKRNQAIRRAAINRYKRWMQIKATGYQIRAYLTQHRIVGSDSPRWSKSQMAERFAARTLPFVDETIRMLEGFFGTRENDN